LRRAARALRRKGLALLAGFCVAVSGEAEAAPAPAPAPAPYELVDLASSYASFWDETRAMPAAERLTAFKARFDALLPGFFVARRAGIPDEQYDAAITRSFERFPAIRERFTAIVTGFPGLLGPAHESFARAFPDLQPIGPIYLVHGLGEFDGGTRQVAGHTRLLFGADAMAQLHDFADEQPFFHHELFHVHHARFFRECEEAWCALWSEGLAVFVAQQLNPRATDAELLLSSPRPIRAEVERNRVAAICAAAARLDSKDAADYAALFSNGPAPEGLPPRAGYFIGYLVAKEAAKNASLADLAHLDNEAAHELVAATLARLARCAPKSKRP
jgi:hypothetical protein